MLTVKYVDHAKDEERVFEAESVHRHGAVVIVNHDGEIAESFGIDANGIEIAERPTYQSSIYVMNRFGATVAKYFVYGLASADAATSAPASLTEVA